MTGHSIQEQLFYQILDFFPCDKYCSRKNGFSFVPLTRSKKYTIHFGKITDIVFSSLPPAHMKLMEVLYDPTTASVAIRKKKQ